MEYSCFGCRIRITGAPRGENSPMDFDYFRIVESNFYYLEFNVGGVTKAVKGRTSRGFQEDYGAHVRERVGALSQLPT
jgi:hypothetical protein